MAETNGTKSWTEYFRVITPFLLIVLTWMGSSLNGRLIEINSNISKIDDKLFKHLTNEEIHCPRSIMVTKAEFELVSKMGESQIANIKETIKDELMQLRIELRNPQVYKR